MEGFNQSHPSESLIDISPEATIKQFTQLLREVKPRYDEAVRLQELHERELSDLLHYAELHDNLNACQRNKLYKKIAEVRRLRRACKVEAELLEPLYLYADKAGYLVDQLSGVQGRTRAAREHIERRTYTPRTDILEGFPE